MTESTLQKGVSELALTIDDRQVTCPVGSTIYEAATASGIHIPTFCHHPTLVPVGACRMCLVEIEGLRGLHTSCSTPARDGMVVRVHTSPVAVKARRANIEFLLTNHPLDCPVCDKGGECPLQDQALLDGPGQSRYVEEKRHKNKRYPLGELIVLDQERCVLCWRCIRFLDEWADDHELDLFARGAATRLDTFPGRPLTSKWQGNTIDICPVGALTSRVFRFEARVWELTNVPSVCPLCGVGCNITVGVKNNEIRRIVPRDNPEVNETWICDKGRFAHAYVDDPGRLQTPLIRRDGELQPATWDEALDLIATRFTAIAQEHGPEAIGGVGSTRTTNEASYLFQRFLRTVVGTNNIDHIGRIPAGITPLSSLPDLERRDAILLLGFDPSVEAPLVELWIKKAALRHGARVIAAHPHRIELARYGTWLGYRPGSGTALLNGLAKAILDSDQEIAGARTANVDEFLGWLKEYGSKQVGTLTGVDVSALQDAARVLAGARHPVILYGPAWLSEPPFRGQEPTADSSLDNLALLLGGAAATAAMQSITAFIPEDNNSLGALAMGLVPDLLPGYQPFADHKARGRLAGLWGGRISPVAGLDLDGMMSAAQDGKLQALWIIGADPATEYHAVGPPPGTAAGFPLQGADSSLVLVPFLVVQDLFLTATAEQAEVVLPAASFAEIAGTYTNLTGRLQAIQPSRRPPGQARPDWAIIASVAQHMVDRQPSSGRGKRGIPQPYRGRRAWEFGGAGEILAEISRAIPGYRDLDLSRLEAGTGWQPPPGTVESRSRSGGTLRAGARRTFTRPEAPDPKDSRSALRSEAELILFPGRLLYDRGTLLLRSERIQKLVPEPYAMIHPLDANRLGLEDGDDIFIESAQGSLPFRLQVSDAVVPGIVYVPQNLGDAPLSILATGVESRSRSGAGDGLLHWVRIVPAQRGFRA